MNLYYVAISRARHEARVYTNSITDLPSAISRRFDKSTALTIHHDRQLQRSKAGVQLKGDSDGRQALKRQRIEYERKQAATGLLTWLSKN